MGTAHYVFPVTARCVFSPSPRSGGTEAHSEPRLGAWVSHLTSLSGAGDRVLSQAEEEGREMGPQKTSEVGEGGGI